MTDHWIEAMELAHVAESPCWPDCRYCDDPVDPDLPTRVTQDVRRLLEDEPGPGRKLRSRLLLAACVALVVAWVVFVAADLARAGVGA